MMRRFDINDSRQVFVILAVIIFIIFGNSLFNGFVYDDGYLIVKNKFIKDLSHIKDACLTDVTVTTPLAKSSGYYRPISVLFLMFSYKLWGLNAAGLHLTNLLLHLLNAFFVFLLLTKITRDRFVSFLASIVFAVHPIHVEAVTPIYNYMGLLAAFFSLASFYFFIKSFSHQHYLRGSFILSIVFLFLGVFSKEDVLIMPFVFLLYDFYFIAQFQLSLLRKRWKCYLFYFSICAIYLLMRFLIVEKDAAVGLWTLRPHMHHNILPGDNWLLHFLTILKTYRLYISLLVFPINFNAFYQITPIDSFFSFENILSIVFLTGLSYFVFSSSYKRSQISFFILLFFVSSFLVSNYIPIGGLFGERLIYLPAVSYCFVFSQGVSYVIKKFELDNQYQKRKSFVICISAILLFFGLQTVARNYYWKNDISLWRDTVRKSPCYQTHVSLGAAYEEARLYDEALNEYYKALKYSYYKMMYVHNEIGKIYGIKKMYPQALPEFYKAVQIDDHYVEAYYNIGITYFNEGRVDLAEPYLKKAMNLDRKYPWSYYGLGLVYRQKGKLFESQEMFKKALQLDPQFALAKEALKSE